MHLKKIFLSIFFQSLKKIIELFESKKRIMRIEILPKGKESIFRFERFTIKKD